MYFYTWKNITFAASVIVSLLSHITMITIFMNVADVRAYFLRAKEELFLIMKRFWVNNGDQVTIIKIKYIVEWGNKDLIIVHVIPGM